MVVQACKKAGLLGVVQGIEVETWAAHDRRLAEPNVPELVGVAELADLLGVSRQRASDLQKRPGFPEPLQVLASGPVWARPSVEQFAGSWDRKPGRPRKIADDPVASSEVVLHGPDGRIRAKGRTAGADAHPSGAQHL